MNIVDAAIYITWKQLQEIILAEGQPFQSPNSTIISQDQMNLEACLGEKVRMTLNMIRKGSRWQSLTIMSNFLLMFSLLLSLYMSKILPIVFLSYGFNSFLLKALGTSIFNRRSLYSFLLYDILSDFLGYIQCGNYWTAFLSRILIIILFKMLICLKKQPNQDIFTLVSLSSVWSL